MVCSLPCQAQEAVNAAQKSPITLDELESIKAIAEEQIRRCAQPFAIVVTLEFPQVGVL